MPRSLDPAEFFGDSASQPDPPQVDPRLALAMYGVRQRLPTNPMLRRCFHALIAMFQAAHNCDYYITKYQSKPPAAMKNLLSSIGQALGALEAEDAKDELARASCGDAAAEKSREERARKMTLRIMTAVHMGVEL